MKNSKINKMVKIAILAGMGALLMNFKFPLPFAPPFMSVDFADVASLIGGFAMGPLSGVLIVFVKNIIKLIISGSLTVGVGEVSNFIVGASYVFIASLIYKKDRTHKGAIKGLIIGSLVMTMVAVLSNAFFVFPLYRKASGFELQTFVDQTASLNSLVTSYWTLMLFAVVPFNLVKSLLESIVTHLLYKRISPILKDDED